MAGAPPSSTPSAENAVTKALRAAGFPDVETKAAASGITNKVVSGIQKRILKLDELDGKISEVSSTSLLQKSP